MQNMDCRELGKAYAQDALKFLMEKTGGKGLPLEQLLLFQSSAASWLAASGFGQAIEKGGMDEAEHFLSLIMAGISACIRLKGAPVLVTFQAEMKPVEEEMAATPPVSAAEATAPAGCSCPLVNGECPICPKELKENYLEFTIYLVGYLKEMGIWSRSIERFCKPCGAKYADQVLAELTKGGISPDVAAEPEPLKQQAVAIALQTVQAFNLTDAPLTVAALRERQGQG